MRKFLTILMIGLLLIPVTAQNESSNGTVNNNTQVNETEWYTKYWNEVTNTDILTLVSVLVGLILIYVLGKVAFKLIKWAIIIIAIILVLSLLF